ncbi:hypothetical protein BOVATA_023070 [Babesia ovata]|uniref:Uncharacterized protein n=1 Tax=Babesia ovata TaxID=189622 RepID=A0A2H6KCW3_9APIC|nr:uncharacterized protein BOVATA_023070 [Babesia ovata]GBE60814.1 hypothetical protein BOVATA_023070 [Babesia ovata]
MRGEQSVLQHHQLELHQHRGRAPQHANDEHQHISEPLIVHSNGQRRENDEIRRQSGDEECRNQPTFSIYRETHQGPSDDAQYYPNYRRQPRAEKVHENANHHTQEALGNTADG